MRTARLTMTLLLMVLLSALLAAGCDRNNPIPPIGPGDSVQFDSGDVDTTLYIELAPISVKYTINTSTTLTVQAVDQLGSPLHTLLVSSPVSPGAKRNWWFWESVPSDTLFAWELIFPEEEARQVVRLSSLGAVPSAAIVFAQENYLFSQYESVELDAAADAEYGEAFEGTAAEWQQLRMDVRSRYLPFNFSEELRASDEGEAGFYWKIALFPRLFGWGWEDQSDAVVTDHYEWTQSSTQYQEYRSLMGLE